MRAGSSDRSRDVRVRNKFSKGQRCNGAPRGDLQRGAGQMQREVEAREPAFEVGAHLSTRLTKERIAGTNSGTAPAADEPALEEHDTVADE